MWPSAVQECVCVCCCILYKELRSALKEKEEGGNTAGNNSRVGLSESYPDPS